MRRHALLGVAHACRHVKPFSGKPAGSLEPNRLVLGFSSHPSGQQTRQFGTGAARGWGSLEHGAALSACEKDERGDAALGL